ncbi:MAG: alpha/beta fold hydrolase [Acidimicrobiia bacterium]|nr:alpha/beta fold hydrolase [Acidimicrobiia bacterium]
MGLWRDLPDRLREATGRPRTIVYSRHGYGRSAPPPVPRPPSYMHHEARVVLPELLDRLGVTAPVLVGHSDGASIALLHAGAGHPVAGLVLLAPHVFVEDRSVEGVDAARRAFATTDLRARLARHHDDVDVAFGGWCDVWLSPAFRAWDIQDHLAPITCPVLVVQGGDDAYGTLAQVDAIAAGVSGPVERLVLAGVGHGPQFEAAGEVLPAIARFIRSLPATPNPPGGTYHPAGLTPPETGTDK